LKRKKLDGEWVRAYYGKGSALTHAEKNFDFTTGEVVPVGVLWVFGGEAGKRKESQNIS